MIITKQHIDRANDVVQGLYKICQGPQEAMTVLLLVHLALYKGVKWPTPPDTDLMLAEYAEAFKELDGRFGNTIEPAKPSILGPDGKPMQ